MAGRPAKYREDVTSPLDRVHWLVRSHRNNHADPAYRDNASFAQVLGQWLSNPVTATLVGQYEMDGPRTRMTLTVLGAYARAFSLDPDEVQHFLLWCCSNAHVPPPPTGARPEAGAARVLGDLAVDASDGRELAVGDWLAVADFCARGGAAGRTVEKIAPHLALRLAMASGRDARVLQEAALHLGAVMARPLQDVLDEHPARGYHAVEAIARLDAAVARPVLEAVIRAPADPWLLRSAVEGYTDLVSHHGGIRPDRGQAGPGLRRLGHDLLHNPSHTVRQQAGQLLAAAFPGDERVAQVLRLPEHDSEVQATASPSRARRPHELVRDLVAALRQDRELPGALLDERVPDAVSDALFSRSRTTRAEAGWMLRLSPYRTALSAALCRELADRSRPFEHQRSMVRVVGALGVAQARTTLTAIATDEADRDRTVRLVAAWDLGSSPDPLAGTDAAAVYEHHSADAEIRRCAVNAAGRLGHTALLTRAATDSDRYVRAEAQAWRELAEAGPHR